MTIYLKDATFIEAIGDGRRSAQKIVEYSTSTKKGDTYRNRQEESLTAY